MTVLLAPQLTDLQTAGAALWRERTDNLVGSTLDTFFPNGVAFEVACETRNTCPTDARAFKGFLHRWLAVAAQVAPFKADAVLPVLRKSAAAAAGQCTSGANGRACGFNWSGGPAVNAGGAGEQMSVLAAVSSLLISEAKAPVTGAAGGGPGGSNTAPPGSEPSKPSSAARTGAGVWPLLLGVGTCCWAVLMG